MAVPKDKATKMREMEDLAKSEVSELFLLLKSGKLSEEEKVKIRERIETEIRRLQEERQHCIRK